MNRAILLPLVLLLLCLGLCTAGCSEAGEEPWYTPAPTPEMTIPFTPLPTCPTLTAGAVPDEGFGKRVRLLPGSACFPPLPPDQGFGGYREKGTGL